MRKEKTTDVEDGEYWPPMVNVEKEKKTTFAFILLSIKTGQTAELAKPCILLREWEIINYRNSMDNKELIYDQFFGENTMNYVELKNRTTGMKDNITQRKWDWFY